jgi:hypothetical protein
MLLCIIEFIVTYLVASLETAVVRGSAGLKDSLDVDGHIAMWAAEAAHDREPEPVLAPLQLDDLLSAVDHGIARHAAVPRVAARLLLLLPTVAHSKTTDTHLQIKDNINLPFQGRTPAKQKKKKNHT